MIHGRVLPDVDGRHPHATFSYVAQGYWATECFEPACDAPVLDTTTHSLMLSVPHAMHFNVLGRKSNVRSTAALVPWRDSGVGLLVVAVLDMAGRTELGQLERADRRGQVFAGLSTDADPNVVPLFKVNGFADAIAEALSLRRLTAREVVAAISELRAILRGPAAQALLGLTAERLESLTVNVVQPV